MLVAQPTMVLWQMMWGLMPMLRPRRSMWTQQLQRAVPRWCRSRRRWSQRMPRPALRHPLRPIFFLNHGSP